MNTAKDSTQPRFPVGIGLVLLLLALLYQLWSALQSVQFLNQQVIVLDDAYYYFQVARNLAEKGWATFDGIHATSGIQLLWGLILTGIAFVFNERIAFLHATLVLSALLNGLAGILLWRFGRKLYAPVLGELAVLIWAGFMFGLRPTMMGMEYPLHITIIIATIGVWWGIFVEPKSIALRKIVLLGILLTLNYWTRLDSAVYSLLILLTIALAVWRARIARSLELKGLVVLGAILTAGAIVYAAANFFLAGTWLPISGLVKSLYAAQHFADYSWTTALAGHIFWWLEIQARPILDVVSSILLEGDVYEPLALLVIATALGASLWAARQIYRERFENPQRYHFAQFLGLLWLFGVVHVIVVVMTIGHFAHITQHYWGWLFVTWCLWGAVLTEFIFSKIKMPQARRITAAIGLTAFVGAHLWFAVAYYLQAYEPSLNNRRVDTAAWINANLPADARIGAWNAGVLGYFSDRTVVNLDGLANDRAYLDFIASGAPLENYLKQERIDYVVDVDLQDLSMPYRATWDHTILFRNTLLWSHVDILNQDPEAALYVLHLRNEFASK